MKCNLNIGVLGDELNIFIQAPQDASNDTLEGFVNGVLFVANLLVLVNNVLKDKSNESNKCDKERSHGN